MRLGPPPHPLHSYHHPGLLYVFQYLLSHSLVLSSTVWSRFCPCFWPAFSFIPFIPPSYMRISCWILLFAFLYALKCALLAMLSISKNILIIRFKLLHDFWHRLLKNPFSLTTTTNMPRDSSLGLAIRCIKINLLAKFQRIISNIGRGMGVRSLLTYAPISINLCPPAY